MTRWLWVAALLGGLAAAPASAATVEHLNLKRMVEMSELVVIGTVTAQGTRVEVSPRQVFTETAFEIEEVVQGDKARPFMVLEQLGGTAYPGTPEEFTTVVPGYPQFRVGERVLLFLERTPAGNLVITGLGQGKYTLFDDPKTGLTWAARDTTDLNIVRRQRDPDLVFMGAPRSMDRMPLPQLLGLIQGRPVGPDVPVRIVGPKTRQLTLPAPGEVR
ncbi:MAG: hypothetical protein KC613_28135 [Myxococcales bacterium]|nr:hypothetical protein [Myxococcales bacterium]MCB9526503.1 hypothetical protein [Myxococcales bacterium]